MKITGNILECKVLCNKKENIELAKILNTDPDESDELFLDFAIDMRDINAIKPDLEYNGNAVLYCKELDVHFCIDVSYTEILPIWIEIKNKEKAW